METVREVVEKFKNECSWINILESFHGDSFDFIEPESALEHEDMQEFLDCEVLKAEFRPAEFDETGKFKGLFIAVFKK